MPDALDVLPRTPIAIYVGMDERGRYPKHGLDHLIVSQIARDMDWEELVAGIVRLPLVR